MPGHFQASASGSQEVSGGGSESAFEEQFAVNSGFENSAFDNSSSAAYTAKSGGGGEESGSDKRTGRFVSSRVQPEETLENQSGKLLAEQYNPFNGADATNSKDSWTAAAAESHRSTLSVIVQHTRTYFEKHRFTSEEQANRLGMTSFCVVQPSSNSETIGNKNEFIEE